MDDSVSRMIRSVDSITDNLLKSHRISKFSFESCYRTIYNLTNASPAAMIGLAPGLWQRFRAGLWYEDLNWEILQDVWLYPIRNPKTSKEVGIVFERINSIMNCYKPLLHIIARQYHLPIDVERIIISHWVSK